MIGILGISHKTASLEIREKFTISNDEIPLFAEELQKQTNITDIVVLSTCNRTEIYFSQHTIDSFSASILLYNCLISFKKIDFNAEHYFYTYLNDDAVAHLFKVTAGIDSMVIGEDQIIGQVKEAYLFCTELALTDAVLMRLFQKSFEAGKRVRTETAIKMGATSVSYVALDACVKLIKKITEKTVLLIGTGETGALTLQGLKKKGVTKFLISNRTPENAEAAIKKYNAEFIAIDDIKNSLHKADIIITATGANHTFITKEIVEENLKHRNHSHQVFIDLSVPRNIEESVNSINHVDVICVDDLQIIIDENKDKRAACIEQGEEIINQLVSDFMEWLSFRALQPAIRAINFHLQKINRDELHEFIPNESKNIKENIKDFSGYLTQKYSRELIKNLKDISDNGRKENYLQVINDLFKMGH